MKNLLILLSMFFIVPSLFSQNIAINNSGADPHESALLDVSSTTKGVLIPRMTKVQRDAIAPLTVGLMIYQSDESPGYYYYNGSGWIKVGPADFTDGGESNGVNRSLGNTDNYSLSLLTNNSERIKIFNDGGVRFNGNIGIFTDPKAPGINKAIDLYDATTFSNPYLKISGHNSGYIDLISRRSDATTGRSYKIGSGGGSSMDLDKFYIQSSIDGYVFAIRDGGNVGINTLNPLTKLQVDGNITFAPAGISTDESRFIGQSIFSQSSFEASNGFGGMEVENIDRSGDDDSAQQLHFWTHHQGVESARRMTIDTVGFVGVGTESPDNILEVARDGAVSNIISTTYRPGGFSGGGFVGRGARGSKDFPSALQNGDFMASFNARGYGSTGFSPLPRGRLAFIAAQDWTDTEQGSHMIFETVPINATSDQERMRISSQGNVGIGTENPGHRLDISNDSVGIQALNVIQEGDANGATIDINNTSSNAHALNVYNSGNGYGLDLVIHPTGTGPGGRFTIDNSSNGQPAVYGEHNGVGNVGQFHANNGGNTQAAIFAQTQGVGPAGDFRVNNVSSTGVGINILHKGQGPAGFFRNENATNTIATIIARNDGMGKAGSFHAYNFSNTSSALYAESTGKATALGADNNGDGMAGYFNINGTTNDNNVIEVTTLGTGSAALFKIDNALSSDTVVVIEGNGSGPSIVADGTIDMAGFKMPASPSSGHVLTSDGSGVGTWQAPAFDFADGGEAGGNDRSLGNTDNYALSFLTNNTERVKIFNDGGIRLDGNLGIFTNPKAPGINKAIDLYDNTTFSNPYLKISGHNSAYINLESRRTGTTNGKSWWVSSGSGSVNDLDRFFIYNSTDAIQAFTIRGGGNIGIGINDPLEKLHVNGNLRINGYLADKDGDAGSANQLLSSTGTGTDWVDKTSIVDFKKGGEIAGMDRLLGNQDNYDLGLITNNLNRLHIQNDGKIGIGTTTPSELLEIEGGASGNHFGLSINQNTSSKGYPALFFKDHNNLNIASILTHQNRLHLYFRLAAGDFVFDRGNGSTVHMILKDSGKLGIGTTSPDEKLHVAGNMRLDGSFEDKDGEVGGTGFVLSSTGSETDWISTSTFVDYENGGEAGGMDRTLGNTDSYALSFKTNNTDRVKIFNDGGIRLDGNLGIFTNPKAPGINKAIELFDDGTYSNPYLKISGHNSGYIDLVSRRAEGLGGRSYKVGSGGGAVADLDRFYIQSSVDGYVFTIRDGGNVGIGNTDPKSSLHVDGGIQLADDSDTAAADKVGTLRYRSDSNNSYVEMCMQTGASTYAWVIIKQNTW